MNQLIIDFAGYTNKLILTDAATVVLGCSATNTTIVWLPCLPLWTPTMIKMTGDLGSDTFKVISIKLKKEATPFGVASFIFYRKRNF